VGECGHSGNLAERVRSTIRVEPRSELLVLCAQPLGFGRKRGSRVERVRLMAGARVVTRSRRLRQGRRPVVNGRALRGRAVTKKPTERAHGATRTISPSKLGT